MPVIQQQLDKYNIEDIYPLSPMQEGMLFHHLYDKNSTVYFEQMSYRVKGKQNIGCLEKSFGILIERHAVLRTVFSYAKVEKPLQIVLKKVVPDFCVEDITSLARQQAEEYVHVFQASDRKRTFDLAKDVAMRLSVLKIGEEEFEFVWSHHHILMDGWCIQILLREFFDIYRALLAQKEPRLPVAVPYNTYTQWLEKQDKQLAAQYWSAYLNGFKQSTWLPAMMPSQSVTNPYDRKTLELVLPVELTAALTEMAARRQVTLNIICRAIWGLILSRYNNHADVIFGSVVSGRPPLLKGVDSIIGLFINTIPVRVKYQEGQTFSQLIEQLQKEAVDSVPYQYMMLSEIQALSSLKQHLLNHIVIFENYPIARGLASHEETGEGKFQIEKVTVYEQTNYDLTVLIIPGNELTIRFEYNGGVFDATALQKLLDNIKDVAGEVAADENLDLSSLKLLNEAERHRLLYEFNNTAAEYPKDKTIINLFEEQVLRTPEKIATIFEDRSLTYRQLNERVNQLADCLRSEYGIGADDRVALQLERSEWMIISLLGILKAGGAYVPIDTQYPAERIGYLVQDSGSKLVIDQSWLDAFIQRSNTYSRSNPIPATGPGNLMYVIYTSGSTGKPKGCMLQYEGIVNRLWWMWKHYAFNTEDVVLQRTTFTFDVSVWELFMPLCFGARQVLCSRADIADPMRLQQLIKTHGVTFVHFVPSLLNVFMSSLFTDPSHSEGLKSLRGVFNTGEALRPESVWQWYGYMPSVPLHNLYGPTEASLEVSSYEARATDTVIPIGKPISNMQLYILDEELALLPIGVPGEIYIGGIGLARGYLNNEKLTNEKFISNPYGTGRLYRTGDIGKYRHDGNIEFLGRTDDQVKIRGHRIELGEIEHVLMQFPGIQTAIVIDLTDEQGDKRLFAYLLLSGQQIDLKALKVFAEKKLPVYMVPAGFAVLDQLPLTSSGKADKKALMAMGGSPMLSNSYQAPGNDLEQKLCTIWENILQVKQVGVRDNLFELGGHSLTIIRMIAAIRRQLTLEVSIPDIFSHPTVESLAAHLQGHNTKGGIQQLSARTTSSPIPLSFGQERIWFVHKMEGSVAYHIPALFRIKGALSDQSLSYALQSVIERHDVLRTVFVEKDGVPYQQLIDTNNWQLKVWDYGSISEASLKENLRQLIVQPFDLAGDYMLKAHLIKLQPGEHLLLIIIHHIAADGWSLPVILRDVVQSYSAHVKGVQKELPPLKIRYADFAIWQRNNLAAEALNEKIKYWKNKLDGVVPLQLPTDKARPAIQTTRGANLVLRIDKELNDKIHQLATKQQSTVFMTLLAIMKVLLSRYSNQNDISIGVPVAGRMFEELEQLAGFFVNTLVLRTKIDVETSFQELLKQITNETIEAYEYQHTPFEKIVEAVVKERDMSRHPLFQVMFAYENYDVDRPALLQLPGLAVNGEALPGIASKFDCTFNFQQLEHELLVTLEYNADLFEQTTMKRILGHFVKLMQEVTSNPLQPIASLQLLNEAERHQLLHEFNSTTAVYPQQKTITALFEEQVMRTPEKTAVVFEDRSLTYRQLNERANQLAHYLRNEYGVGADDRVALLLDRSEWMIVSILGVLKAGGAYVPVDPQYPAERISYILNDCNAKVLITHTDHLFLIENYAGGILAVDVQMDMLNTPVDQPVAVHDPFNLAYVIYTSGSSGQPKGVMIEHRSLINTQYWRRQYYSFDDSFCFLLLPSFAFDSSVNDVFSSLLIGGQLVIVKEENLFNVKALIALLIEHKVSHFNAVPALYNALLDSWEPQNLFLKVITLAGEKLTAKLLQRHFSIFPHVPVINEYGPTENAICSTAVKITQPVEEDPVIGTPISNTRTYVLNSHLQLQPIGVPGELFLSGDGLARGYLNREELTNEKFITNPFKKERLYRTGDLVRRLPDGSLQFLGRVDDQVKIRGYRIEPGEIEAVLQQLAEVELAVVIMQQYNNAPVLAAYCVLKSDTDIEVIKQHVINRLPAAMVPSYIIPLQQMPLTPNGKVDKRALPPIHDNAVPGNKYVAPRTELEQKLCAIWEEVLQVKQVGIQDDFFKLGGHSLIVVKLLTCIENTFQVRLDISGIFKDPTIEGQAEQILFFLARKDQQQNKSELIEIDL